MLSTKEITKMYKGTKITSRVDLYKATKSGSKSSQQECRGAVLRNFAGCEFSQLAKFAGCEFLQPCKIFTVSSFSSAFLLQISSGLIMHLRIRLGFIVFESD